MSDSNEKDNVRTLEEICDSLDQVFQIEYYGNTYCFLGMSKKIECSRQSMDKDHKGNYHCFRTIKGKKFEDFGEGNSYSA